MCLYLQVGAADDKVEVGECRSFMASVIAASCCWAEGEAPCAAAIESNCSV